MMMWMTPFLLHPSLSHYVEFPRKSIDRVSAYLEEEEVMGEINAMPSLQTDTIVEITWQNLLNIGFNTIVLYITTKANLPKYTPKLSQDSFTICLGQNFHISDEIQERTEKCTEEKGWPIIERGI